MSATLAKYLQAPGTPKQVVLKSYLEHSPKVLHTWIMINQPLCCPCCLFEENPANDQTSWDASAIPAIKRIGV